MVKSLSWLLLLLVLLACTTPPAQTDTQQPFPYILPVEEDTTPLNEPFYPYTDYILAQIQYVDTTPFAIEKTVQVNGRLTDSGFISKEQFKKMAKELIRENPNNPALKPQYRETSMRDLSINRLVFSITASNTALPLQQADILVNPETQAVKNVLLKKYFAAADSTVTQQVVWVDKMNFQISETIQKPGTAGYTRVVRVVWDKPLE